jgi:acetyltransferase-like isoleucine patch superfamily enzyme
MTISSGYFSETELKKLDITFGNNVLISKKCSIYTSNFKVGSNVRIDDFCVIKGNIIIGSNVHIASFCQLEGQQSIIMENFSGLSSRVSIFTQSDDYSGKSLTNPMIHEKFKNVKKGKVEIKEHVIVGTNSVVLPGVKINEGSAVGAFSLINKDLEPWSVYAGIPSRKIKERSKEILKLVENIKN